MFRLLGFSMRIFKKNWIKPQLCFNSSGVIQVQVLESVEPSPSNT